MPPPPSRAPSLVHPHARRAFAHTPAPIWYNAVREVGQTIAGLKACKRP
ncbi:hypothetical protein HMPREF1503_1206 [Olsenella uli MSTE5]|nr:hypothetical protein HMPREF1503_1206 [Olsenella uli MSTE5]